MKATRYLGILILVFLPLTATRAGDDSAASATLALEQLIQSSPGQVVQPLPGQVVPPLPGQIVQSLPDQMVRSLPGQMVQSLPGQMVRSLSGQIRLTVVVNEKLNV